MRSSINVSTGRSRSRGHEASCFPLGFSQRDNVMIKNTASRLMHRLHERIVLVLSILFGICLVIMAVHVTQIQSLLVKAVAFAAADVYMRALTEFRTLYTSEVVQRLQPIHVSMSQNDQHYVSAIPLPATLTRMLGQRMAARHRGETTRLYSPYPFPLHNGTGGLQDQFEQEAWAYLNAHPDRVFYRFEERDGQQVLRYATPDIMREECVHCHNTHPESPKRDWQVGQVRGILEVRYPVRRWEALSGTTLWNTYGLMGIMAVLWLGGLGLVVTKLRRTAQELEHKVEQRTAALKFANGQLEEEIRIRREAEAALREARDQLEQRVSERTAALAEANEELKREIAERRRAEESVRKLNDDLLRRTAQLEASNKELEAFSYSVSHDLRAPLRGIDGFSQAVLEDYHDKLDDMGRSYLQRVRAASQRMAQLIDAMLNLARLTRADVSIEPVNLSEMAKVIIQDLQRTQPHRTVTCTIAEGLHAEADPNLIRVVLENLLGNAWKFTSERTDAHIEFGCHKAETSTEVCYYVRDNGAGFDMTYVHKLFGAFQRLHAFSEFPGVGIGLATVQRIIQQHGGRVWAEGTVGEGATFYFTLRTNGGRAHER
ncbi:MAG: DUF3365 domain-containing protein [Nitrospirae bacterium]|nr:MAG: DUF3365 domain-containing protein [Nitrospirota bacterium]